MNLAEIIAKNSVNMIPSDKEYLSSNHNESDNTIIQGIKFVWNVCKDSNQDYSKQMSLGVVFLVFGCLSSLMGAAIYAEYKNRSKWFCLLGLFMPIGIMILAILEDKS